MSLFPIFWVIDTLLLILIKNSMEILYKKKKEVTKHWGPVCTPNTYGYFGT